MYRHQDVKILKVKLHRLLPFEWFAHIGHHHQPEASRDEKFVDTGLPYYVSWKNDLPLDISFLLSTQYYPSIKSLDFIGMAAPRCIDFVIRWGATLYAESSGSMWPFDT